jgi:hypothetical protein
MIILGYVGAMKLANLCQNGAACTNDCLPLLCFLSGSCLSINIAEIGPAVGGCNSLIQDCGDSAH